MSIRRISVMDITRIPTPCYVVEEQKLKKNISILGRVQDRSGCKIILALKGFAMHSVFTLLREQLKGVSASSLNEARLGYEEFRKEVHLYAPAYREDEIKELIAYSDHIIFNSFSQLRKFKKHIKDSEKDIQLGMRINPEHSEVKPPINDPCSRYSRFGVTLKEFNEDELDGITGLHFHVLCENNADALERTLSTVENKFGTMIHKMKWINFGGGHHITRNDYDIERLCALITDFKERYQTEVYLEPGESVALNAGVLVASVLDIHHNEMDIAILDASASTHMPDVLKMPYRPGVRGASVPGTYRHRYRLSGPTCLAGDVIGDYSFPEPLKTGDKLIFEDMLHYTMVKNTTFNGLGLPSIGIWSDDGEFRLVKKFGYEDYKSRLS